MLLGSIPPLAGAIPDSFPSYSVLLPIVSFVWSRCCPQAVQPSTGDIIHDEFEDGPSFTELETRFEHIGPEEILLPNSIDTLTANFIRDYVTRAQRFVYNECIVPHPFYLVSESRVLQPLGTSAKRNERAGPPRQESATRLVSPKQSLNNYCGSLNFFLFLLLSVA